MLEQHNQGFTCGACVECRRTAVMLRRGGVLEPRTIRLGGCVIDLVHGEQAMNRIVAALEVPKERPLAISSINLDHFWHFGRGGGMQDGRLGESFVEWYMLLD